MLFLIACLFQGIRADLKRSVSGCHTEKTTVIRDDVDSLTHRLYSGRPSEFAFILICEVFAVFHTKIAVFWMWHRVVWYILACTYVSVNCFYREGRGSGFLRGITEDHNLNRNSVALYVEALHTAMAKRRNVCLTVKWSTLALIYVPFQNVSLSPFLITCSK